MPRLAPYADLFKDPKGPGEIRPTAIKIVEDQGLIGSPEWTGRVVLITGCSPGGLGPETAKALRLTGADIYITSRDIEKGNQVAKELLADGREAGKVEHSISGHLSCNASPHLGVMAPPYSKTKNGFEIQFGTNHLGHFYLFRLVKDALLASATPTFNSRVLSVSSAAHRTTPSLNFSDLTWEKRSYPPQSIRRLQTRQHLFRQRTRLTLRFTAPPSQQLASRRYPHPAGALSAPRKGRGPQECPRSL